MENKKSEMAITRPLRHFEVDKYWLRVAELALRHSWTAVFDQFSWWRLIVPSLVAVVASGIQFYVLGWASTVDNLKIVGTSVLAGLCVFAVLVIIHLVRKPCELAIKSSEEIARLRSENERLRKPVIRLALAEEDPKVYMEAMNDDFTRFGYMPFKFSTKGQRVNPAQGITVQPIKELPSIVFDYIDRIDATAEKIASPKSKNHTFMPTHNIVTELQEAWQEARQAGTLEDAELPFKVTIHYRDAKQLKFISEVSFKYSPLEEDSARRSSLSSRPREFAIIKVTNTDIRRLS